MSTVANGWLDKTMARITSSEKWELVQPIVSGLLVLAGLGWLVRNALRRRAARPQDLAGQLLADLEKRAARVKRERRSGETPLAWFDRLDGESRRPEEREILRGFAESYEESVYRERNEAGANSLRETAKQLRKIWRSGAKI
jgi:flagellar biosynthesis/type III secretory pathway M-ring protein FliF/YscJ